MPYFNSHLWNGFPGHLELKDETACLTVFEILRVFYYSWPTNNSTVHGTETIPPINWVLIPVWCTRMLISCDLAASLTSQLLGSAKLCLTPSHRSSSLIIWDTVQWGSIMGRAGNIFSCFKEFPPRYVPGTDFSGSLREIKFEGWLDSNGIISIYGKE